MRGIVLFALLFLSFKGSEHCVPCLKFQELNDRIVRSAISKTEGRTAFASCMDRLRKYAGEKAWKARAKQAKHFPLQGYDLSSVGGSKGNGFISSGYNYFDGNKHGGHPAHDIFIRDANQDCLDDRTGKEVNVCSVSAGIVVALQDAWDTASDLRGGKFIYIYDPLDEKLIYYAHCRQILVKTGEEVKAGQAIATVGRSGLNAFKKRSPTHLHLMMLDVRQNQALPYNFYPEIRLWNK